MRVCHGPAACSLLPPLRRLSVAALDTAARPSLGATVRAPSTVRDAAVSLTTALHCSGRAFSALSGGSSGPSRHRRYSSQSASAESVAVRLLQPSSVADLLPNRPAAAPHSSSSSSPPSSFPTEFVSAYAAAIAHGLRLGLSAAERDSLRAEALARWLRERRAVPSTTPFVLPAWSSLLACLHAEIDATVAFYRSPAATPPTQHAAAWHTFCLKTLLTVARGAADAPSDAAESSLRREALRCALSRLLREPALPVEVAAQLRPALAAAGQWDSDAAAAAEGGRVDPLGRVLTAEHIIDRAVAAGNADGDGDGDGDVGAALLQWRQGDDAPVAALLRRQRGHRARAPAAGKRPVSPPPPPPAAVAPEASDGDDRWAAVQSMWAGHYRTLVRDAVGAPADGAAAGELRARPDMQLFAERLLRRLGGGEGAVGAAQAMPLLAARAASPALAEVYVFLLAMDPTAAPCTADVAATVAGALARGDQRWVAVLTGALLHRWCSDSPGALEALAGALASLRRPALLEEALLRAPPPAAGAGGRHRPNDNATATRLALVSAVGAAMASGGAAATGDDDAAFTAVCLRHIGDALLSHWAAAGATRGRHYRFPAPIERALWGAFLPLATEALAGGTALSTAAAPAPGDVAATALAVVVQLQYVWDSAVCPQRRQRRRRLRSSDGLEPASALCDEMVDEEALAAAAATGAAVALRSVEDYAAPAPVPRRTVQLAQLLTAALEHRSAAIADGVALTRVCSAALIPLREIDSVSALRLLAALDGHATALRCAGALDTRAALAMLRCVHAASRQGCPAPQLAVAYFSAALQLCPEPVADTLAAVEKSGRRVDWPGEAARVLSCLAHSITAEGGGPRSHAERVVAILRFTAFLTANGVELSLAARLTVQEAFVARRSRAAASRAGLFAQPPWSDIEEQYRAWLSAEEHVQLLLSLPEMQRGCARALLCQGQWTRALSYVPATDVGEVRRRVFGAAGLGRGVYGGNPTSERRVVSLHILLYLCATDNTQSCAGSARAVASQLLATAPDAVKQHFWATWQRWYRAAATPLPPPPRHSSVSVAGGPVFRPNDGRRTLPRPDERDERDGELRVRFAGDGQPSFVSRCCALLSGVGGTGAAPRCPPPAHATAPALTTSRTTIGTSYVGAIAATKHRS